MKTRNYRVWNKTYKYFDIAPGDRDILIRPDNPRLELDIPDYVEYRKAELEAKETEASSDGI